MACCHHLGKLRVAIHQPHYFPYAGFFHKLSLADAYVIMDDVQYDKRFTNRNRILTPQGWIWLSVPIKKEHKFLPNMSVEINNDVDWRTLHWKQISLSYVNTPFFRLYKNYLEDLYRKEWRYLFELDFETLTKTTEWLGLELQTVRESTLGIRGTSTERLVEVCKALGADTYIAGRGSVNYMHEKLFEANKIKVEYQDYTPSPYPQRFSTAFVPDLSIIDMLMNVGPNSLKLIKGELRLELPQYTLAPAKVALVQ